MVVSPNMVKEAEAIHQQSVQYRLCMSKEPPVTRQVDVAAPILREVEVADSVSADITRFEPVLSCLENVKNAAMQSSTKQFLPFIRSGSYVDIGPRTSMEDEHITIDDLSSSDLCCPFRFCAPSAFYAIFDGHGGPEASSYIKKNAMNLFFDKTLLPESSEINDSFLNELESSYRQAFLMADLTLADEPSISSSCGTTALTALILGRHLFVANAGDCRAVLCRRGTAVEMSQDHRPSYLPELKRVEDLGGFLIDGYLNGYLSVTRALGDWDLKLPLGSASPLISEPDFKRVILTEDDEFLIIACDGLWDVMSSQYAVSVVRQGLRRHSDPQQCSRELVIDALRLNTTDNLTVIVVCLTPPERSESCLTQKRRFRCCNLSEEARIKLRDLLGGN